MPGAQKEALEPCRSRASSRYTQLRNIHRITSYNVCYTKLLRIYKIYMESFKGEAHLDRIQKEAQEIVSAALAKAGV